jgi:2-dehydropantoate 2-reductase
MKIVVLGCGAIGSLAAGYLKLTGQDVQLVGRGDSLGAVKERGINISGVRGNFQIPIEISERLTFKPRLLILATKTQDIDSALSGKEDFLRDSLVLTTQNGIQADELTAKHVPKENIVSSIIMFGATRTAAAEVVHNFEGNWIIGRMFETQSAKRLPVRQAGKAQNGILKEVSSVLNAAFSSVISEDLKGMKYLKVFINANNCIPAILGKSMQEAFSDIEISRISIAIWKEGLDIVKKCGINLVSLPGFPLERLTGLTSIDRTEAAKVFSGIMLNLSKEPLDGSVLQSIKRNQPSEIDYINGEFITLAKQNGFSAPLNEKLVEMVHNVEKTKEFFGREELIGAAKEFV